MINSLISQGSSKRFVVPHGQSGDRRTASKKVAVRSLARP